MNKSFDNLLKKHSLSIENFSTLKNATTDLQGASPTDVVFYKFNGLNAEERFKSRMEESNPGFLILSKKIEFKTKCQKIFVDEEDFLPFQKYICDHLYSEIPDSIKFVGVTGTNGKTSVAYLASQIASKNNHNALFVGTIGIYYNGFFEKNISLTTPSYCSLRRIIWEYSERIDVVFMEVSSHALYQSRLYDIKLNEGAWTNITHDHLDYHHSFEEYFQSKFKIFNLLKNNSSRIFIPASEKDLISRLDGAKDKIEIVDNTIPCEFFVPEIMLSGFLKINMSLAIAINKKMYELKVKDFRDVKLAPGRYMIFKKNDHLIIVDYAHTPDALENVLKSISKDFNGRDIIAVFGAGGDRDKSKRPEMGLIAEKYANKIIVTSDNPRSEPPMSIINDITESMTSDYNCIVDREKAINTALEMSSKNNVVLIAGKGHEDYQEVNGRKLPFSDIKIVEGYLNNV